MYSVILLTAMTASAPEVPQFGLIRRGCYGCGGCYGYASCWGCVGACYGCSGCTGCVGCTGGCYGRAFGPMVMTHGVADAGGWHFFAPYIADSRGRWGYAPGYGFRLAPLANTAPHVSNDVWGADYTYSASRPFPPAPKAGDEKRETNPELKGTAKIVIEVPADARVFVDGQPTRSTSAIRQFHTPTLNNGETYYYDVRVETTQGDKPIVENRRLYVRANEVVRESFRSANAPAAVASK